MHTRVLCRNLKLLQFDFAVYGLPTDPETLCTPRKSHFLSVVHFLLRALDSDYLDRELKKHAQPSSEVAFRAVASKWFRNLTAELKPPASFFWLLGHPYGPMCLRFLRVLSSFVLNSHVALCQSVTFNPHDGHSLSLSLPNTIRRVLLLLRYQHLNHAVYNTCCDRLTARVAKLKSDVAEVKKRLASVSPPLTELASCCTPSKPSALKDTGDTDDSFQASLVNLGHLQQEVLCNRETVIKLWASRSTQSLLSVASIPRDSLTLNSDDLKAYRISELIARHLNSVPFYQPDTLRKGSQILFHTYFRCVDAFFGTTNALLCLPASTAADSECSSSLAECIEVLHSSLDTLIANAYLKEIDYEPVNRLLRSIQSSIAALPPPTEFVAALPHPTTGHTLEEPMRSSTDLLLNGSVLRPIPAVRHRFNCISEQDDFNLLDDTLEFINDLVPSSPI